MVPSQAEYGNLEDNDPISKEELSLASADKGGNIPWVDTKQSIRSREMLNKIAVSNTWKVTVAICL
jgi:hypothetical protein